MVANSLLDVKLSSSSGTLDGSKVRVQRVRIYPTGDPQKVEVCSRSQIFPSSSAK